MSPPGPFVRAIERTGTTSGLVPAEAALVFDPNSFVLTDVPGGILGDAGGGLVTGYTKVALGTALVSLTLGPAGQWTMGPVATGTSTSNASTSTSAALATLTVPPSSSVTVRATIKGRIDLLPTLSIFADLAGVIGTVRPASGNADPLVTNSDAARAVAVVAPFSGPDGGFVLTGNVLAIGAGLGTIPAWANTTAYTAGPAGVARHVVTNDTGKIYACITAGTSAGSGGPTGTGSNITDGTAHWAYVGTSITINWTLLPETLVG